MGCKTEWTEKRQKKIVRKNKFFSSPTHLKTKHHQHILGRQYRVHSFFAFSLFTDFSDCTIYIWNFHKFSLVKCHWRFQLQLETLFLTYREEFSPKFLPKIFHNFFPSGAPLKGKNKSKRSHAGDTFFWRFTKQLRTLISKLLPKTLSLFDLLNFPQF